MNNSEDELEIHDLMFFDIIGPDNIMDSFWIKICGGIEWKGPYSVIDQHILKFEDAGTVYVQELVACRKHVAGADNETELVKVFDYAGDATESAHS